MSDFIISLLVGGGIGYGAFALHKRYLRYENSYQDIKKSAKIESPASLKMNISKYQNGNFAVIDGVVATADTESLKSSDLDKYLHNLNKHRHPNVYKGIY